MKGIINAFKWLIDFLKLIFSFVMNVFKAIGTAFDYIIAIIQLAITTIGTLPPWILSFAMITLAISAIYFIVGRNTGKSD